MVQPTALKQAQAVSEEMRKMALERSILPDKNIHRLGTTQGLGKTVGYPIGIIGQRKRLT